MIRFGTKWLHGKSAGAFPSIFCRCLLAAIMVISFSVEIPMSSASSGKAPRTEDLIRSAMVFNFCKFVQWPLGNPDPIILGVVGDPNTSPDFSSIIGKSVHESTMEVRYITSGEEVKGCNLIFITQGQEENLQEIISVAKEESILTISEIEDFCSRGGIIQLVSRRGKLRFFINNAAAGQADLSLSSQLLKMARIVEGR